MSSYDLWLLPEDPHSCDDPDCDNIRCYEHAIDAREDAAIDAADARRKGDNPDE